MNSIGLYRTVGQSGFAATVHLPHPSVFYQLADILRCYATASEYLESTIGCHIHQLPYYFSTPYGRGCLTRGQQTVAAAPHNCLQSLYWRLVRLVKGTVEGHLYPLGGLDSTAGEADINLAVGGQEAYDNSGGTQSTAPQYSFLDNLNLSRSIHKIPRTRSH